MADIASLLAQGTKIDPLGALGKAQQLKGMSLENQLRQQKLRDLPAQKELRGLQAQNLQTQIDAGEANQIAQMEERDRKVLADKMDQLSFLASQTSSKDQLLGVLRSSGVEPDPAILSPDIDHATAVNMVGAKSKQFRDIALKRTPEKPEKFGSEIEAIAKANFNKPFRELSTTERREVLRQKKLTSKEIAAATGTGAKAQERGLQKAEIIIGKVDDALEGLGLFTTGFFGKVLGKVAGTPAFDLKEDIETIKAIIGFEELQAMREASPTGGALGQVAVQELKALQSVLGSLEEGQSEARLRKNLKDIRRHYVNWKETVDKDRVNKGGEQRIGDIITAPNGKKARILQIDPNGDHEVEVID